MGGLDCTIYTKEDLKEAVQALGFLPLFANEIQDFSIEEHTVPKAWFRTLQISVGMGMISMHCMMMGLPITGIRNYMSFWKGNPLSCQEN